MAMSPFVKDVLEAARSGNSDALSIKDLKTLFSLASEAERVELAVKLYQIAVQNAAYKSDADKCRQQLEAILQAPARVGILVETLETPQGQRRALVSTDGGLIDVPMLNGQKMQVGDRVGVVQGQDGACLASSYGPFYGGINALFQTRENGAVVLETEHNEVIRARIGPDLDPEELEEGSTIVRVVVLGGLEAIALGIVSQAEKDGANLVDPMPTRATFADLAGIPEIIARIKDIVVTWYDRALAEAYGLDQYRGLLLVGLPGTGKTELTYAIANYAAELVGNPVPAFEAASGKLLSHWYSLSEKNIRRAAEYADRQGTPEVPALIAFQDFEGLVFSRRLAQWDVTQRVTTAVNAIIDRDRNWIPLATANCPENADPANTDRFHVIEVGVPDESGVREILALKLNRTLVAEPIDQICDRVVAAMRGPYLKVTIAGKVREFERLDVLTGRRITKAVELAAHIAGARDRRFGSRDFTGLTSGDVIEALLTEFHNLGKTVGPQTALSHLPISLEESRQVTHVHYVEPELAATESRRYIRAG